MLALGGVLVGLGVLALVGVGARVLKGPPVEAERRRTAHEVVEESFAVKDRELGRNTGRDLEIALAAGLAGIATGTAVGAAFGAAAGPAGAVVGAFAGAIVGLIKAAVDTEAYGTVVRETLKDYLRQLGQPTSSRHVDAMVYRDALLGAAWVWFNAKTGAVAVEVLELAHGRREHFHNMPYSPRTSLTGDDDRRRHQMVPGRAASTTLGLMEGTNVERLDGEHQRADRRRWWEQMRVGDLYEVQYSTGHAAWNPSGSYTSGPGFRSLWPSLSTRRTPRTGDWHKIHPDASTVDMLAGAFDRAAGISWEATA